MLCTVKDIVTNSTESECKVLADSLSINCPAGDTSAGQLFFGISPLWASPIILTIAVAVSIFAILKNSEMARKRATLDMIEKAESNDYYLKIYTAFKNATADEASFKAIYNPGSDMLKEQRNLVIAFLNHYETIALGIKNKILDEDFYRQYFEGTLLRHWKEAEPFVKHLREPTPDSSASRAFIEFEKLATEWKTPATRKILGIAFPKK